MDFNSDKKNQKVLCENVEGIGVFCSYANLFCFSFYKEMCF